MRLDHFLCVRNHQLPVIIQKPIQHLKNFRRGKIELIEYDPMSFPHCRHQRALLKHEVTSGIADIGAEVHAQNNN